VRENRYLVWIVVLAAVVLLNLPLPASMRIKESSRDNIAPFQNGMSLAMARLREWFSFVIDLRDSVNEKREMALELAALREQLRAMKDVRLENKELREQLGFVDRSESKLVPCRLVLRGDTSGWWQTLRLNRGSDDGIAKDMAVITTDGLIGRTLDVSARSCDVLLITDPNFRVSCRLVRTRAFGVVTGAGVTLGGKGKVEMLCSVKPYRMDYMPKDDRIEAGDEVVTSGLGGVFPEGIPVGRVQKSFEDPSGLYKRADVLPAADLEALKFVFVVVK